MIALLIVKLSIIEVHMWKKKLLRDQYSDYCYFSHGWYSKYNTNTRTSLLYKFGNLLQNIRFHWKTMKHINNSHFKLEIAPQITFYTNDHQKYVLHSQSKFAMISKKVLNWKFFSMTRGFLARIKNASRETSPKLLLESHCRADSFPVLQIHPRSARLNS